MDVVICILKNCFVYLLEIDECIWFFWYVENKMIMGWIVLKKNVIKWFVKWRNIYRVVNVVMNKYVRFFSFILN